MLGTAFGSETFTLVEERYADFPSRRQGTRVDVQGTNRPIPADTNHRTNDVSALRTSIGGYNINVQK